MTTFTTTTQQVVFTEVDGAVTFSVPTTQATFTVSDAVLAGNHAATHAAAGADPLTLAQSQVTGLVTDLAGKVALTAVRDSLHISASAVDSMPRDAVTSGAPLISGSVYFTTFTPLVSVTVSGIQMATWTPAASGLTLARMGLYTYDGSTFTLVARTASDTSLFVAAFTSYTRAFDTTGGYPATYDLVAGTQYALGVIATGATMPNLAGHANIVNAVVSATPRLGALKTGETDLLTSSTTGTSTDRTYWARFA